MLTLVTQSATLSLAANGEFPLILNYLERKRCQQVLDPLPAPGKSWSWDVCNKLYTPQHRTKIFMCNKTTRPSLAQNKFQPAEGGNTSNQPYVQYMGTCEVLNLVLKISARFSHLWLKTMSYYLRTKHSSCIRCTRTWLILFCSPECNSFFLFSGKPVSGLSYVSMTVELAVSKCEFRPAVLPPLDVQLR